MAPGHAPVKLIALVMGIGPVKSAVIHWFGKAGVPGKLVQPVLWIVRVKGQGAPVAHRVECRIGQVVAKDPAGQD
jgi:hypothetical protein